MNQFLELLVSSTGRSLIMSFKNSPRDWVANRYNLNNTRTSASLWIANGAIFFNFQSPGYLGWIERFVVFYYAKRMINRKIEDELTGVAQFMLDD